MTLLHLISLICFIFAKATIKVSVLLPIELCLTLTSPDYLMASTPSHTLLLNFGTASQLVSVILLVLLHLRVNLKLTSFLNSRFKFCSSLF